MREEEQQDVCSLEDAGLTKEYNASMYWGTYRPHLFLGVKTRSANPVVASVMWHKTDALNPLRHEATSSGIKKYGWVRHDGRNFGHEVILDENCGVNLNFTFVKHGHDNAKGGDWAVRVSASPRATKAKGKGTETTSISLLLHVSSLSSKGRIHSPTIPAKRAAARPLASFTGSNPGTGSFTVAAMEGERREGAAAGEEKAHFFAMKAKSEHAYRADELVEQIYRYSMSKSGGKDSRLTLPDENQDEDKSNSVFLQLTLVPPGYIDIVFLSHALHKLGGEEEVARAAAQLSGPALSQLIAERTAEFDKRFDTVFKLRDATCIPSSSFNLFGKYPGSGACTPAGKLSEGAVELGKVALSQLMGGLSYLHGTWVKADPPFYNTTSQQAPASSFTCSPCRDGFARGFLWDEGFHQLLMTRWEPAGSRDVLLHWLGLMQPDGWIPRENFIGPETRRRIEARWWTQYPEHANPPTLLLALQALHEGGEAPPGFLKCVLPRLKTWLNWFKRTQQAPALHSFKWSGRIKTEGIWHTLSSGLDDYPRANASSAAADRHLDLFCWVALMHKILAQVSSSLGEDSSSLLSTFRTLLSHLEAVHWNNETQSFQDRGYMAYPDQQPQEEFVQHHGYVSLFPLLLQLLNASDPKLLPIIQVMSDRQHLFSKAGLRSLSPKSPEGGEDSMYGTQEDYWRGKVWINLNYLALKALKRYGESREEAAQLYVQLRQAIMENMLGQYTKKGYIFEQYDDKTGEGLKHKPFAGWSSLVLLIMAEMY
uniref:Mannosyl-oligosaccharide glucosidase n=1 Tax=Guillardia theta TaxID=55529 RepID=A0A7S4PGV9_GUITH